MAEQGVSNWIQTCTILQLCVTEVLPAPAETSRNYYDILNVEPTATDSQIKRNFRKLAVKYHPDKNKSTDAERAFGEIAEAYQVLSNKEQRRLYDHVGHEAFLNNDPSVDPGNEHEDILRFSFADLFHDFDEIPFVEEPYFYRSFHQDEEDEGAPYERYSFEEPGFIFHFNDDENVEENYY